MKYFTLLVFCGLVGSLSAQTNWHTDIVAKFDFAAPATPLSVGTSWSDEFNGDTELVIFGSYYDDEEGPSGSYNAIGLAEEQGTSYLQVVPGSDDIWGTTDALTLSFGFMDFSENDKWNPIAALVDDNGQWLNVSTNGQEIRLEYAPDFTTASVSTSSVLPSPSTHQYYPWHTINISLDKENHKMILFMDGQQASELNTPFGEWQGLQVYFANNAKGNILDGWFCYSDIYLHQRTFNQYDAMHFRHIVKSLVDTRDPILTHSSIQVFPNLLTAQSRVQIQNPENLQFQAQLVNASGQTVSRFTQQQSSLDLAHLPNGTYQMQLFTTEGVVVHTLIKQ